ncbi:unnamed protein product, partial [Rotaria sp. Silwood1]
MRSVSKPRSANRAAKTHPAVPPPTITNFKSNIEHILSQSQTLSAMHYNYNDQHLL